MLNVPDNDMLTNAVMVNVVLLSVVVFFVIGAVTGRQSSMEGIAVLQH
jgi:hypothetical protein